MQIFFIMNSFLSSTCETYYKDLDWSIWCLWRILMWNICPNYFFQGLVKYLLKCYKIWSGSHLWDSEIRRHHWPVSWWGEGVQWGCAGWLCWCCVWTWWQSQHDSLCDRYQPIRDQHFYLTTNQRSVFTLYQPISYQHLYLSSTRITTN